MSSLTRKAFNYNRIYMRKKKKDIILCSYKKNIEKIRKMKGPIKKGTKTNPIVFNINHYTNGKLFFLVIAVRQLLNRFLSGQSLNI